jgi:hypothetical protein
VTDVDELLLDTPATRPCTHPRAKHQHGTYMAYKSDRCRCRACAEAKGVYERDRYRRIAYGRWQAYADATEVRAHVEALMRAGMGWRSVAARADVHHETVKRLLYGNETTDGPATRVRNSTARKLLAVQADRRRTPPAPDLLTEATT